LGSILVRCKLITPEQLEQALERQRETGKRIGETLLEMGFLSEDQLQWALGTQLDIPYVHLTPDIVDREVVRSVPEKILRRYQVVPIMRSGDELTLVMADPLDRQAIVDIEMITGCRVNPAFGLSQEILSTINEVFAEGGRYEEVEASLELTPSPEVLDRALQDVSGATFVQYHLARAVSLQAREIHFEPLVEGGLRVRYRLNGVLREQNRHERYPDLPERLMSRLRLMAHLNLEEGPHLQQGTFKTTILGEEYRFRVNIFPTVVGESAVVEVIPHQEPPDLAELGFDQTACRQLEEMLQRESGVILLAGPSGSGRTTTAYALLRCLDAERRKVVTVEETVSFTVDQFSQIEIPTMQRLDEVLHTLLQRSADVLLLDNLRTPEALAQAFEAALVGRLVLATTYFRHAEEVLAYLRRLPTDPVVVASLLLGIVTQRLVRLLCEHCRQPMDETQMPEEVSPEELLHWFQPVGCPECNFTGFSGRVLRYEVVPVSPQHRQALLQTGREADQ